MATQIDRSEKDLIDEHIGLDCNVESYFVNGLDAKDYCLRGDERITPASQLAGFELLLPSCHLPPWETGLRSME